MEIVSPSIVDDDYIEKPALYARLGIPEFWRVDEKDGELVVEMVTLDEATARYVPSRTAPLDVVEAEG